MDEFEIIRGSVEGKEKYCRIPIRSKTAELMQEKGVAELNAEIILGMPHDTAVRTIDAIMEDWCYWLGRANELFVLYNGCRKDNETVCGEAEMRLIDADKLIKGRAENDPVRIAAMRAPTVYDVDEVAGQLKERAKYRQEEANDRAEKGYYGEATELQGMAKAYEDAMEIVKAEKKEW